MLDFYSLVRLVLLHFVDHLANEINNSPYYVELQSKLSVKERFDKEQIGVKEPFPVTNCQFTS